ncbi:MAG: reverse transcriptase, partial [Gammaproteobacteria bacterium RIFCSPHIGHO2_12_FULL_40_19]
TLFDKIHKRQFYKNHNHEVHFLARDRKWLLDGIQSLIKGNYEPRCLKRYYFSDERVDQLHLSDRVLQHLILRIVKPTFQFVMNKNCYHLDGPTGVKNATRVIREVLQDKRRPQYFIRADIKSFYKSILHHKLIADIKQHYSDPKLIAMLRNIINNPIDTPYGYKNPDFGIALRGPLSQFFSGIYLKPLDDAFDEMEVTYLRYQDDILILCHTKRQLNRCKRRMMMVLQERRLSLSKRKTRMGSIHAGFHFLGISYSLV